MCDRHAVIVEDRFNPRPPSRADDDRPFAGCTSMSFNPRPPSRADDVMHYGSSAQRHSFNPRPPSRADDASC